MAKVVGTVKKVDLKKEYKAAGIEWDPVETNKFKINDSTTENGATFSIQAVYAQKPQIPIPSEWIKTRRQYLKDNPDSSADTLYPEYFYIEARFGWEWTAKNQNWDLLQAGHNLMHYIRESDSNLIEAHISNDID